MQYDQWPTLSQSIKPVANFDHELGEGPLWIEKENKLYWLDIEHGKMFRYAPDSQTSEICLELDRPIGGIAENNNGSLLLMLNKGGVVLWKDGQVIRTVVESIERETPNRFNDCIVDPLGRVYVGSIHKTDPSEKTGHLHRIDPDGSIHLIQADVGIANGMGFSPDLSRFYFTDSYAKTIWQYDHNADTGELSNQRIFLKFDPETKNPDGMTIDAQGHIWVAQALHSHIEAFDADGKSLACIEIPAKFTSSLTFGGANYETIFITTGHSVIPGLPRESWGESAGTLLAMPAPEGITGRPEFKANFKA